MADYTFTYMYDTSGRSRRMIRKPRSINDIKHVIDVSDSWVCFSMNDNKDSLYTTGRALRSRLDAELPCFVLAYQHFSDGGVNFNVGVAKAKAWWLEHAEDIIKHYAFAAGLDLSAEDTQTYVAISVGLIEAPHDKTVTLPDNINLSL